MLTRSSFRDAPIRRKLVAIIMLTTAAAMLLACFGILLFDSLLFRANLSRDLTALARITAENSTAALEFNDAKVGHGNAERPKGQEPSGDGLPLQP